MAYEEIDAVVTGEAVIHKHKHKHSHKHGNKDKHMSGTDGVNIFASSPMGTGAGMGGGYGGHDGFGGGGILGGLLIGALLGRGGLGGLGGGFGGGFGHHGFDGCGDRGRCATPDDVLDIAELSKLGDIQGAIPLAQVQNQLALAGVQNSITTQNLEQTLALSAGQTAIQLSQANTLFQLSNQTNAVNFNVEKTGWQVAQTVQNDGEKTRALIGSIDRENLNRQITVLANEVTELRHEGRRREGEEGIRINMINNQNQNQLQFQAQSQFLNTLHRDVCDVAQYARATNSNVIVGNTGASTTGAQTASPTNVRA